MKSTFKNMKRSISSLLLILFCFISPIMNDWPYQPPPRPAFHEDCERMNKTQPLNYLGTNLILTEEDSDNELFEDSENLLLCPGDAIGDLNATYVKIGECNLTMYHKDQIIWSKGREDSLRFRDKCSSGDYCFCVFSLKRDGNLVLHHDEMRYPGARRPVWSLMEDSETEFYPTKTELRVKDEQLQIIRTFYDGSQRFFYLDETHPGFTEDMGEPIKIADKFIIKNHSDPDKTILRRNEYIGDLNGTYLILQPNCKLQLLNKNKTVWSLTADFKHDIPCALEIAQHNTIEIFRRWMNKTLSGHSIMESEHNSKVIESKITFSNKEPIIIQTLKNESELIFYGGRRKREPTQIAQKTLTAFKEENSSKNASIERMEYIGNLTGLHLILEQNCSLILANGNEKLWEFQSEPRKPSDVILRCSIQLAHNGQILLHKYPGGYQSLLERSEFITGVELTLENDQIVIKRTCKDRDQPEIFYAGRQTNGTFFQFLAQNSIVVNHTSSFVEILPKMEYIGNLNGVHFLFNKNCSLAMYNKTQVLWELQIDYKDLNVAIARCSVQLEYNGQILLRKHPHRYQPLPQRSNSWMELLTGVELTLKNDQIMIKRNRQDRDQPNIFYAGRQTNGTFLQFLGQNSITIPNSNYYYIEILPKMGYIGDLNGIYVLLDQNCNLVLYNKTQVLWESGTSLDHTSDSCGLGLQYDWEVKISANHHIKTIWSGMDIKPHINFVQLLKVELSVANDELWLIYTFRDGTVNIEKPIKGTNRFTNNLASFHHENNQEFIDEEGMILQRNKYIIKEVFYPQPELDEPPDYDL